MKPAPLRALGALSTLLLALVTRPASAIVRLGAEEPVDTTVADSIEGFWSADHPALIQETTAVASRGGALLLHRSNAITFATQRLDRSEFSPARELTALPRDTLRVLRAVEDNDGMLVLSERYVAPDARDLYALRIDANGVARAAAPTWIARVSRDANDRIDAACASDACTIVSFAAPSTLQVYRLTASGAVTSQSSMVTAPTYAKPTIVTNGTSFLVSLLRDVDQVQLIAVSAAGALAAPRTIDARLSDALRLAYDGHSFVLQYVRSLNGLPAGSWEVRARRLRDDASDFAPSRDVLLGTAGSIEVLQMFRDGDALRWVLGAASSAEPARTVTLDHADTLSPVTPWLDPSALSLEYSDRVFAASGGPLVFKRRAITVGGSVGRAEIPVIAQVYGRDRVRVRVAPGEPARQRSPRLVRQGSTVRVLWAESREDIGELYARDLLADGTRSPTTRLPVDTDTIVNGCLDAQSVGDELFISWQDRLGFAGTAGAARIRRDRSALRYGDPGALSVYESTDRCPQVFSIGGQIHWVQHNSRQIGFGAEIPPMFFDARGELFGEQGYYPQYVAAFATGSELEVQWRRDVRDPLRTRIRPSATREALTIESTGVTFGDPLRIIEHRDRTRLAVWRDGAWKARRFDATGPIDASRAIDSTPIELGTAPPNLAHIDQASVSLASDQSSFYAAIVVGTGMTSPAKTLEIVRIAKDGAAMIERARPLPATAEAEGFSMLVEAEGRLRVAYGRRDEIMGVSRIYTREVSFDDSLVEQGQRCARDAQCRSGACVDGVCCSSGCAGMGALCGVCSADRGASEDGTCTQVACAPEPLQDGGVDAGRDASAPAVDANTHDASVRDAAADRPAIRDATTDATADASVGDGATDQRSLGGGCQCRASGTHRGSRGAFAVMGAVGALVAWRRRSRKGLIEERRS